MNHAVGLQFDGSFVLALIISVFVLSYDHILVVTSQMGFVTNLTDWLVTIADRPNLHSHSQADPCARIGIATAPCLLVQVAANQHRLKGALQSSIAEFRLAVVAEH